MAIKQRNQNLVVGDTAQLRFFVYNSNNLTNVTSIDAIAIYRADPEAVTTDNPKGLVLVQTLDVSQVINDSTGSYYIEIPLTNPTYLVGKFYDRWTYTGDIQNQSLVVDNVFRIYPQLWYTSPIPVVYDFAFYFQPNKIRKGSKQYLRIQVVPNVPNATDLKRYYENLAILGDLCVSLEQKCGQCLPKEEDLRIVIDDAPVDFKDNSMGYYLLDTCDLECGIYNIWFKLCIGGNLYLSDKMNLQIFS